MPRLVLIASSVLALSAALAGCNQANRDKAKDESASATATVENAAANAAAETKTVASQAKNAIESAAADHGMGGVKSTADFLKDAGVSDMFEIRSSELALKVSTDPAVKKFAHHMIEAHTKMSHDMKGAATQAGVAADLPTDLDGSHKDMLSDLRSAKPEDFDHKYLEDQHRGHDAALGMFKAYADKGSDPTIKAAAAGAVPTIRGHLDMVKALQKAEDDAKTSGAKAPGK